MMEQTACMQIFCDFDGTITERDMIVTLMEKFAPKDWEILGEKIMKREMSVQEGVEQMFDMIDTSKQHDMIKYAQEIVKIRAGFPEFIKFLKDQKNVEFYVTSGGMDFFVYPILRPWIEPNQIFCNQTDWSKKTVQVKWPHTCDEQCSGGCGCCKPSLMRKLNHGCKQIVIGDSVTDAKAAKAADLVFARSHLIEICKQDRIDYHSFENFFDILNAIEALQEPV